MNDTHIQKMERLICTTVMPEIAHLKGGHNFLSKTSLLIMDFVTCNTLHISLLVLN